MTRTEHTAATSTPPVLPRSIRQLRAVALILAGSMLTACAVGPQYRTPPPVDTGSGWSRSSADATAPADLARWWTTLGDPVLDRLIDKALAENLDLRQAAARIDEARALRDRIAGGRAPVVDASAGVNRRRQSENGPLPIGEIPGLQATQTIYDAGFDAAWEVDLFGARRRALEAADARLQATEADAEGVRMRVVAEVARTWFDAVGAGRELRVQQATVATLQQTLDLARRRADAGDVSSADVDAAYAQWATADAALPGIRARQRGAVLGLAVLLGEPPERELALLDTQPATITLQAPPVGQRADLLRRRPDVLAAERRLAASTADIGVATADLFPKLSISAGGGFQALGTDDWFDASSRTFSILPLISWRLFDGGRVRAEIRARDAQSRRAALAYEQAVLAALDDAERTLGDYHAGVDTLQRREGALEALRRCYGHAEARYAAGDISLFELLVNARLLHDAEMAAARAHTTAAVRLVALYKALGGGWDVSATTTPAAGRKGGSTTPTTEAAGPSALAPTSRRQITSIR